MFSGSPVLNVREVEGKEPQTRAGVGVGLFVDFTVLPLTYVFVCYGLHELRL